MQKAVDDERARRGHEKSARQYPYDLHPCPGLRCQLPDERRDEGADEQEAERYEHLRKILR